MLLTIKQMMNFILSILLMEDKRLTQKHEPKNRPK